MCRWVLLALHLYPLVGWWIPRRLLPRQRYSIAVATQFLTMTLPSTTNQLASLQAPPFMIHGLSRYSRGELSVKRIGPDIPALVGLHSL